MLKTSNHWLSKTQVDYIPSISLHRIYQGNYTTADMAPKTATLLLFGVLLTTKGGAIVAPPDVIAGAVHSSRGRQAAEERTPDSRHHLISHSFQHGPLVGAFQLTPFVTQAQGDFFPYGQNLAQSLGPVGQPQSTGSLFTHQLSSPNHQTNTVIIKGRADEQITQQQQQQQQQQQPIRFIPRPGMPQGTFQRPFMQQNIRSQTQIPNENHQAFPNPNSQIPIAPQNVYQGVPQFTPQQTFPVLPYPPQNPTQTQTYPNQFVPFTPQNYPQNAPPTFQPPPPHPGFHQDRPLHDFNPQQQQQSNRPHVTVLSPGEEVHLHVAQNLGNNFKPLQAEQKPDRFQTQNKPAPEKPKKLEKDSAIKQTEEETKKIENSVDQSKKTQDTLEQPKTIQGNETLTAKHSNSTSTKSNGTSSEEKPEGRAAYSTSISGVGPLGVYGATTGGLRGVGLNGKPYGATLGKMHGASLLGSYGGSSGGLHGVGLAGKPYGASHAGLKGSSLLGSYGLKTGGVHGGELPLRGLGMPLRGGLRVFRSSAGQYVPGGGVYQAVPVQQVSNGPQKQVNPASYGPQQQVNPASYRPQQQVNPPSYGPQQQVQIPQVFGYQPTLINQQYQQNRNYQPQVVNPQYQPPPQVYQPPVHFVPQQNLALQPQVHQQQVHQQQVHHGHHKALHDYPYNFGEKDSKYDKARAKGDLLGVGKLLGGAYESSQSGVGKLLGGAYETTQSGGGKPLGGAYEAYGADPNSGAPPIDGRQNPLQSRPSSPPLATLERLTNQRMELTRDLLMKPLSAPLLGVAALLKASVLGVGVDGGLSKTQETGNYKVLTGYNSHKYDHTGQDYGFGQLPSGVQQYVPQYATGYGTGQVGSAGYGLGSAVSATGYPGYGLGSAGYGIGSAASATGYPGYGLGQVGNAGYAATPGQSKGYGQRQGIGYQDKAPAGAKGMGLYHQVHRDSGFDVKETKVGGEVVNLSDKSLNLAGHFGGKH